MVVQTIGVVGAGTMGTGIAQVAASTGLQVILIDVDPKALSKAMERIGSGYDRLVAKEQMGAETKRAASRSHRNGHKLRRHRIGRSRHRGCDGKRRNQNQHRPSRG